MSPLRKQKWAHISSNDYIVILGIIMLYRRFGSIGEFQFHRIYMSPICDTNVYSAWSDGMDVSAQVYMIIADSA